MGMLREALRPGAGDMMPQPSQAQMFREADRMWDRRAAQRAAEMDTLRPRLLGRSRQVESWQCSSVPHGIDLPPTITVTVVEVYATGAVRAEVAGTGTYVIMHYSDLTP
jgi:hypothetical protein